MHVCGSLVQITMLQHAMMSSAGPTKLHVYPSSQVMGEPNGCLVNFPIVRDENVSVPGFPLTKPHVFVEGACASFGA
jgi:hypothetical protein